MSKEQLFNLGYRSEWDGYDRNWMARFVTDRRDLDHLVRGANQARKEMSASENRIDTPTTEPIVFSK